MLQKFHPEEKKCSTQVSTSEAKLRFKAQVLFSAARALNFFYFLHRSDLTTSQRNAEELAPPPPPTPSRTPSTSLGVFDDLSNVEFLSKLGTQSGPGRSA